MKSIMQRSYENILNHDNQLEEIRKVRLDLIEQFVDEHCPVAVGEIIKIRGYAHTGKNMRVGKRNLVATWGKGEYIWKFGGYVLKKDGAVGKMYAADETRKLETG